MVTFVLFLHLFYCSLYVRVAFLISVPLVCATTGAQPPQDGRRFPTPHLAILRTADDTSLVIADLLLCEVTQVRIMVRIIITRAIRHLATATLGMIGGDAFRAV